MNFRLVWLWAFNMSHAAVFLKDFMTIHSMGGISFNKCMEEKSSANNISPFYGLSCLNKKGRRMSF